MTMPFTKLDPGITDSSLWSYPSDIRIVWITILARCDKDGYVRTSMSGLQRAANVPMEQVEKAVALFEGPDQDSRTTEHDGRRIERVPGGWHVLNHAKYRHKLGGESVKDYWARKQEEHRRKLSMTNSEKSMTVNDSSVSVSASVSASDLISEEFEKLWELYPSKTGKEKARTAWIKWRKEGDTSEQAKSGIERYKKYVEHRRKKGFKELQYQNGATFFNQRGWLSEWTIELSRSQMPEYRVGCNI